MSSTEREVPSLEMVPLLKSSMKDVPITTVEKLSPSLHLGLLPRQIFMAPIKHSEARAHGPACGLAVGGLRSVGGLVAPL